MAGYRIDDEAVNRLLRAVLNGSDADATNLADALLSGTPAEAVVLALARAAVQRRRVGDWAGAEPGEDEIVMAIARTVANTDSKALLAIASELDALGEEVAARGFALAAGETLGWTSVSSE